MVRDVLENDNTIESTKDMAQVCLEFAEAFGVSIPTTCCYQFPKASVSLSGDGSNEDEVCLLQAFLFLNLGICIRI